MAPFSSSPSTHWKFAAGNTKEMVRYTKTPRSGHTVRAELLLFSPILICCIFEVHMITPPVLYSLANVI